MKEEKAQESHLPYSSARPLRILVVAYACNPRSGSEHAVGWGFIRALSEKHQLVVITEEEKCKVDVEAWLAEHPKYKAHLEFHFIRKQRSRLLRRIWPPSYYFFYRKWHLAAYALAQFLNSQHRFDLVHQLTMVGYREPGYLWKLGIPFVWGPIGGMGRFPSRFMSSLGLYGAMYYTAYNLINAWQERFSSRARHAARTAGAALVAATPDDQAGTQKYWAQASHLMAEVGLPEVGHVVPTRRAHGEPLRIVWSGLHIARKALPLGLRGLAKLPRHVHWRLDVLGQGPLTEKWARQAEELGIAKQCHFHGWVERDAALKIMAGGHVMLITSLRDLTSTVTVEALAQGMPVVCLDHCGFSAAIDDSCGIKVPVTTPAGVVTGLRDALLALDDESRRLRLSEGALARARNYAWDYKVARLEDIYHLALRHRVQ